MDRFVVDTGSFLKQVPHVDGHVMMMIMTDDDEDEDDEPDGLPCSQSLCVERRRF